MLVLGWDPKWVVDGKWQDKCWFYGSALSLGVINFYRTSDKNILFNNNRELVCCVFLFWFFLPRLFLSQNLGIFSSKLLHFWWVKMKCKVILPWNEMRGEIMECYFYRNLSINLNCLQKVLSVYFIKVSSSLFTSHFIIMWTT